MWSHLIKLVSLGKGALVVGVAASAAVVSSAEISNPPSHSELPSATSSAIVSPAPASKPSEATVTPIEQPRSTELPKAHDTAKPEVSGLVRECVEKYAALRAAGENASPGDRESTTAVCKNAIEHSGLSSADFAAKYGLLTPPATTPKTEQKNVGLDAAIKQCLADWRSYSETDSAACAQALAASGLSSEDFWKKFEAWAVQQQGQGDGTTADVAALVKECFAKYTAKDPTALETCKKAMAASGLSGDAFFDKYGRPTPPATEPKPSASPKGSMTEEVYLLIATCFKLHNALTATSEPARVTAAYDACNKAIAASGMTAADFWAKFAKELTPAKPSPTATPKPVTNTTEIAQLVAKCLELYKTVATTGDTKTVSDACKIAIQASGMTSADFWTKYHPATN